MSFQSLASFIVVSMVLLESHLLGVVGKPHHANGHGHVHQHVKDKGLEDEFYKNSCPLAYEIVKNITWKNVDKNSAIPAKLLRLHFHDCFVRGCDGSVLLDTLPGGNKTEKDARPNLSLDGFKVIDEIKTKLEHVCPGKVSCADILALSSRDAVSYQKWNLWKGKRGSKHGVVSRNLWKVQTGRRDGVVSKVTEANNEIPSPFAEFATLVDQFSSKGLNPVDLVALSGAHTIGVAHCGTFSRRLYNFTGKGDADPSLDAKYAEILRKKCPNPPVDPTTTVEMDPLNSELFNNHYYAALANHQGLFISDATLLSNSTAKHTVELMKNNEVYFLRQFAASMVKMGAIGVLTGDDGEIRKDCHFIN